jgi:hypothetical protein
MDNRQKYDKAFIDSFSISEGALGDGLVYNSISQWDSIGHMGLIAALETAFNITMETEDIINFNSYKKGLELLAKYGVKF